MLESLGLKLPPFDAATTVQAATTGKVTSPNFKRLSEAEFQAKKEKGLCFKCDEKYSIGHRC